MDPSEKLRYLKALDNVLSSTSLDDIKLQIEEVKKDIYNIEEVKEDIYNNQQNEILWESPSGHPFFLVIVSLILLVCLLKLTVFEGPWVDSEKKSQYLGNYDIVDISIYFFWLVMPPIFFLFEYIFLFGKTESNRLNSNQITDFKYCQELGSKIWAAVVVCFSILLYVRYGFNFK